PKIVAMRSGLFWKLFLLQMLAAAAVLAGALFVTRVYSVRHFAEYLEAREREHVQMMAAEVAKAYANGGDLEQAAVDAHVLRFRRQRDGPMPEGPPPEGAPPPDAEPPRGPIEGRMPPLQLQDASGHYVRGDRRPLREE